MTDSNQWVMQCQGLSKSYIASHVEVKVLSNVSLRVNAGEKIAIIGASGSGKTTLLNLLGGLDDLSQGSVEVMNADWASMTENKRALWRNKYLGFVYQFHHLLAEFTAIENVSMPLLIRGVGRAEAQQRSKIILSQVGLAHRCEHRPSALSGGERQRVAIARALVAYPACVLMDEPTGNLDHFAAEAVLETLLDLNVEFGISFIIVTHESSVASKMDRILCLEHGVLLEKNSINTSPQAD
tara:strand:+ start:2561 stop:3280 length:720 start_codon:yes stop_codon:yes gene_type:complete